MNLITIFPVRIFQIRTKKLLKSKYFQIPNVIAFEKLKNCKKSREYLNLCKLVKNITEVFKTVPRSIKYVSCNTTVKKLDLDMDGKFVFCIVLPHFEIGK